MKKAVIIGAGPAGLTAAYELLKADAGYEVTVLEASGEIGGISRTVRYQGNRMDIGGHRFFSKDERVCSWWAEILPDQGALSYDDKKLGRSRPLAENGPDPQKEDGVMLLRDRVSRIYYKRHFFDYPITMKPQTFLNMGLLTSVRAGGSYLYSAASKRQENSLEDFYINRFGKVLYSMFFEGYTEKLWGRHPSAIAPDWGAQRVKGLSVAAMLKDMAAKAFGRKKDDSQVETSLIESFRYPKFGPGQLWETAADRIEHEYGGIIVRNAEVIRVVTENGRVSSVVARTPEGEREYPCDVLFSSMPIKDLIFGMNEVPPELREIAQGLPYRDFVTVGLLVDRLALRNQTKLKTLHDIVPDCWIYVQDTGVKLGRIQIFNNWSPYLVADPDRTVWIGLEYFCTEGDDFWNLPEEQCVKQGIAELKKIGVLDGSVKVLDSHREKVKKAYPAYFDTYDRLDEVKEYLNGFENLYCIGRNGQHRYNNMDHSMETAFAAVESELSGSHSKETVWDVNTKSEYHEEK